MMLDEGPAAVLEAGDHTDDELVRQVLAGQTALYELLMRRHNERLYRAARAITRDESEAEDALQQAYVNAFTNLRQFDGRARFATWLTRIVINESLARVRQRVKHERIGARTVDVDALLPNTPADPERQAFAGELHALLEWAIDSLADGSREVFVLREVEGLSTAETAACLEVSEDVVKTRLSRARAALRQVLFERTGATAPDAFRFHRPRCDRLVSQVLSRIAVIQN